MNQGPSKLDRAGNGDACTTSTSVASELDKECEKLRKLADRFRLREESWAEMEANYPHFRDFVYARLREAFRDSLEDMTDKDLAELAKQTDAKPLEEFIAEFDSTIDRSRK